MHLVQITNGTERRVAVVEEPNLRCLTGVASVYDLAQQCLRGSRSLRKDVQTLATGELISYDDVYSGNSAWRLLSPIDVPSQPSKMLVSGTGLTHVGSARQRQSMHLAGSTKKATDEALTDSMRMFQWGIEGGRPPEGKIGIAPEWFYKGDGSCVRAPFEALDIPSHAEDGGEEAELAGVYLVDDDGTPFRLGFVQGNEFSDHKFEKRNYLNLAGSKLRTCSIGPELVVENEFHERSGEVRILRDGAVLWSKIIASGEANMCHSLANIEHHHFKFAGHRQPGMIHIHFFGADALSFGEGVSLQDGDVMEVSFRGFGRTLRNQIHQETRSQKMIRVSSLCVTFVGGEMDRASVALIGLGTMGSGMAACLLKAGFPLTVYNRTAAKASRFADMGARIASSPAEAAVGANVIITMLADDNASREAWLGSNGALAAAPASAILVESSTVSPGWISELAGHASARELELLDAPVTGSRIQAEQGQLTFLVGGSEHALAYAAPVLRAMSKEIVHLGPVTSGARMKLINNFLCGVQIASLAEAMAWIERSGLDREKALNVLNNGAPGSPLLRTVSARMTNRDYTVNFFLELMAKDLKYADAEAAKSGVELEAARAACGLFQRAIDQGHGQQDMSSVVEALRE